jgi:peptide-methionine (S)-S-oxide reductase
MRARLGSAATKAAGIIAAMFLATALAFAQSNPQPESPSDAGKAADGGATAVATFAGGCFWCMEPPFDATEGVISTVSGFMGGKTPNPSYRQVTAGGTGHIEVLQVTYDPKKVSYEKLLEVYWRNIDPYDAGGQFCDRGHSYTTAIFAHTEEQKKLADASKAELIKSGPFKQSIVTEIRDAGPFTAAEGYHQDYYTKNPIRYKYYRFACGRDARLEAIWGKATN